MDQPALMKFIGCDYLMHDNIMSEIPLRDADD